MIQKSAPQAPLLDRTAVTLSGLCVVHCLALPILLAGTPFVQQLAGSHWHAPMLLLVVPVSAVAIVLGYRRHGNKSVLWWAAAGLLLVIAGGTLGHNVYGEVADRVLTVCGSLLLAATHWHNSRLARHARRRRHEAALAGS